MSIEDSMYNIPLLSDEYNYPYSFYENIDEYHENGDEEENTNGHIEPLEIEYEVNNFYGYPFGRSIASENSFKDRILCLFTLCSFCFPFNVICFFIYKYT